MAILPFLAMYFIVLKGFIYAIAADIYAFFVLRFAPFCTAFCTILPCVLHQNALHLAAKRSVFSTKTHAILHLNALCFAINGPKVGANGDFFK